MTVPRRRWLVGVCLAALATTGLLLLERRFAGDAAGGVYFQAWSSEAMMQTVSIQDLAKEPLASLWALHIQPPAFDAIRAALAGARGEDPRASLRRVDLGLYVLWAVVFGLTVLVFFLWVSETTSLGFGAAAALVLAFHPAAIFYATLLDTTILSMFLVLLFCYLLWREGSRPAPIALLAGTFLALYFTRSIFQWPWLLVLPVCFALLGMTRRRIAAFLLVAAPVVALYTAKQRLLFGLASTSSFTGLNLCSSIGLKDAWAPYRTGPPAGATPQGASPGALWRERKLDGSPNLNHRWYLSVDRALLQEFRRQVTGLSPLALARGWWLNARLYMLPSSRFTPHVIVDRLPWRHTFDRLGSAPWLPVLCAVAALSWFRGRSRGELAAAAGLVLPVAWVVLISIVCERGENMRFKFFVEPVLYVFVASQAYAAWRRVLRRAPAPV